MPTRSSDSVQYCEMCIRDRVIADIDTVRFPKLLCCTEAKSGEKVRSDVLDIIIDISFAGRDKLTMQPQHITEWAYQLHIQIVVEVLDFITAAFQFFQSISRHRCV